MFSDLVDIINSLYRLRMTIRNVTPHDRLVRASSVDMSLWDMGYRARKEQKSKCQSKPWQSDLKVAIELLNTSQEYLAGRLGKAISKRRQYMKYMGKYHRKLTQGI
jgi:hypothetical protein